MDCSSPGSSVHGIFQERILEWIAIPFSRASSRPRDWALQADSLSAEPPWKPILLTGDAISSFLPYNTTNTVLSDEPAKVHLCTYQFLKLRTVTQLPAAIRTHQLLSLAPKVLFSSSFSGSLQVYHFHLIRLVITPQAALLSSCPLSVNALVSSFAITILTAFHMPGSRTVAIEP